MYLELLSKILTNRIYETDKLLPQPSEINVIRNILSRLENKGICIDITAEALTDILQYTKKSRNVHTYVSEKSLRNIRTCIERVHLDNISGDLLDCGVFRGGTSIYMAGTLKYLQSSRSVYVADSFQGLPVPSSQDGIFAQEFWYKFYKELPIYSLDCLATLQEVKKNFKKYDLLNKHVKFIKGWFSETLQKLPNDTKFSVIRIDVDWYKSTMDVLENTYDKLNKGGFLIIDDYKLTGCKKAINEFRSYRNLSQKIITVDKHAGVVFWRK